MQHNIPRSIGSLAIARLLLAGLLLAGLLLAGCVAPEPMAPTGPNSETPQAPDGSPGKRGAHNPTVPLEPPDPDRVVVQLVSSPGRTAGQIALDHGLELVEEIGALHAVFKGDYDVDALVGDPDVAVASPNQPVEGRGSDNTFGFYEGDWSTSGEPGQGLQNLSLPQLHQSATGLGVRVLVMDTGVDPDHPYLVANVETLDSDVYRLGSTEPKPPQLSKAPAFGHGTHVSGCVLHVAPDATIVPARILNHKGVGSLQDFTRGLVAALDAPLAIDVVNVSASTAGPEPVVENLLDLLEANGVVVVAAAGNYDGTGGPPAPSALAVYPTVVGVAAVDAADLLAFFSRSGPGIDVAAPGVSIRSAFPAFSLNPPGYVNGSGTSFATPIVSGAIACVMEAAQLDGVAAATELFPDCATMAPQGATEHGRADPKESVVRLLGIRSD